MQGPDQEEIVLITPSGNAEMRATIPESGNKAKPGVLWGLLLAALVLCFVCLPAGTLNQTTHALTMARPEPPVRVRTSIGRPHMCHLSCC